MRGKSLADDAHRIGRRIHHIESATTMDMGFDEARDECEVRKVDACRALRNLQTRTGTDGLEAIAANEDSARRKLFEWAKYNAGIDHKQRISHGLNLLPG